MAAIINSQTFLPIAQILTVFAFPVKVMWPTRSVLCTKELELLMIMAYQLMNTFLRVPFVSLCHILIINIQYLCLCVNELNLKPSWSYCRSSLKSEKGHLRCSCSCALVWSYYNLHETQLEMNLSLCFWNWTGDWHFVTHATTRSRSDCNGKMMFGDKIIKI